MKPLKTFFAINTQNSKSFFQRTGSMYISTRENGTEAPMYTSVGTNENGGNLITLNWENEDAGAGVKLAWPVLHVQTTAEIGKIDLHSNCMFRSQKIENLENIKS